MFEARGSLAADALATWDGPGSEDRLAARIRESFVSLPLALPRPRELENAAGF